METKFIAYVLNVTHHFVMHIISYANVVYFIAYVLTNALFAVLDGQQILTLLHCGVHVAAQGRQRETYQVFQDSIVVCS